MSQLPTAEEVQHLLSLEGKMVIRRPEWVRKAGKHSPPFLTFESAIFHAGQPIESCVLVAQHRGPRRLPGPTPVWMPEKTAISIIWRRCRVAAIDTEPMQRHPNPIIKGRPESGQIVTATTHRHVWTDSHQDGYVETIDPPLLDPVEQLISFAIECRLILAGAVPHPRQGEQGELL